MVVGNDPPSGLGEEGVIGGFKICISDAHQVIYGADSDGLCEFISFILSLILSLLSWLAQREAYNNDNESIFVI